jgi:hypothetical protein
MLAVAGAANACQQSAPPAQVAGGPSADIAHQSLPSPVRPALAADTLARRTRTLLRRYDLTPFWNDPHGDFQPVPVLEGFLGKEHRRLGLAITNVRRDPAQPQVFWVTGKMRLRRVTTPFTGRLTVNKIVDLQDEMVGPGESADSTNYLYTASASFHFRPVGRPHVGELVGQAFFDFVVPQRGSVYMVTTIMTQPNDTFPARGCGMVLRGHWVAATGRREPMVVAKDLFAISSEVFPDFGIGDRGTEVNPKYAHLGWNEAWENEEWWADSPKPRLSL